MAVESLAINEGRLEKGLKEFYLVGGGGSREKSSEYKRGQFGDVWSVILATVVALGVEDEVNSKPGAAILPYR